MRSAPAVAIGVMVLATGIGSAMAADLQGFSVIERGHYLANIADCASCHTAPGGQPFSGGRPIETPFGILVAPNITPDRDTGIGDWSDDQFDAAVRHGRRRDGARLYPAMPFPYYAKMSRDDVTAIRAYLKTVEPVHHAVKVDRLPFPLNLRIAMKAWDALYFNPGEFRADSSKSAEWNRGAYLVQGPGHCGACHTPKSWLGGDETSEAFHGYRLQGWLAPDITNAQHGLADWSVDDIAKYLKTGHNRNAAAAGLMGEVVSLSTSRMTDADTKAIATFLKDMPGSEPESEASADSNVLKAGGAIYRDLCSSCHHPDGKGVPDLFPNLSKAATVSAKDPTTVLRVILQGAQSVATDSEPTGPGMPAFGWQLNDAQVAELASYVRNHFGKKAPPVSESDVSKARSALAARTN
jgi:mono/diheme cytochrome c family protein